MAKDMIPSAPYSGGSKFDLRDLQKPKPEALEQLDLLLSLARAGSIRWGSEIEWSRSRSKVPRPWEARCSTLSSR